MQKKEYVYLTVVLILGTLLRLYHIDYGLHYYIHSVDAFKFVDVAAHLVDSHSLTPNVDQYPTFYAYLMAIIYKCFGIHSVYGHHLVGRLVSALFGLGMIVVSFILARRIGGLWSSVIAALLVSVCVVGVTSSRFSNTDCIVSFFMLLGLYFLTQPSAAIKTFAVAGILLGLAMGTKQTGVYLYGFCLLAAIRNSWIFKEPRFFFKAMTVCTLLAVFVFFMTSPWIFWMGKEFIVRFVLELNYQKFGQLGHIQSGYLDYLISPTIAWEQPWLVNSILYTSGVLVLVLGLLGALFGLTGRFGFVPFFYALYLSLFLASVSHPGHAKGIRYLLPVLPVFYILAAWFVERCLFIGAGKGPSSGKAAGASPSTPSGLGESPRTSVQGDSPNRTFRFRKVMVVVLMLSLPLFPFVKSLLYVQMADKPMTEQLAFEWIQRNVPEGSRVFLYPFFVKNLLLLPYKFYRLPYAGSRMYRLPESVGPNPEREPLFRLEMVDELKQQEVNYVVRNSYFDGFFSKSPDNKKWFPESVKNYEAFLSKLKQESEVVYQGEGYSENRLGPDITVYRLPTSLP